MAKIHALTANTSGNCSVVIHLPMPAGNNLVGKTWKACWLALGRNTTSLAEGDGLAQISAAEKAQVLAADVIELSGDIPLAVVAQGNAAINVFADSLIATRLGSLALELNYYGWVYQG